MEKNDTYFVKKPLTGFDNNLIGIGNDDYRHIEPNEIVILLSQKEYTNKVMIIELLSKGNVVEVVMTSGELPLYLRKI